MGAQTPFFTFLEYFYRYSCTAWNPTISIFINIGSMGGAWISYISRLFLFKLPRIPKMQKKGGSEIIYMHAIVNLKYVLKEKFTLTTW